MNQELFNPQSSYVSSSRIIYTPSTFARTSLLHLQEVGSLQAVHPHVSQRENLVSFLCLIVLSGEGELSYEEQTYHLSERDCVFIDCRKAYSHSTSDDLWSLQWCHFYAPSLPAVYEKYKAETGDTTKTLIASTTSPYKFARSVMSAIDSKYENGEDFALIDELCRISGVKIPKAVEEIRSAEILHNTVVDRDEMKQTVLEFLGL